MLNSDKSINILVTGSKGQLGSEIKTLASEYIDFNFTFTDKLELDIVDPTQVSAYFSTNQFHFVINCAAYTNVDKAEEDQKLCEAINVNGTKNLAKACAESNTVLIHISSDYVCHPEHNLCIGETSECKPRGVYAETKYAGEEIIGKYLENFLIIRSSWIYSSFGHNFVKTMIRLGEIKSELSIVDDQIGSPTYAFDLAEAILKITDKLRKVEDIKPYIGIYNYSNLGLISWADFAQEIFNLQKLSTNILRIPSSEYPTPAPRPLNSRLSKSKIADTFQLELRHWKKSLKKCLEEIDN